MIGGLYASGYSVEELEKLATTLDWQQALSDAPPRKDVPFRRKQDDRDFWSSRSSAFATMAVLACPWA